jgi:phosphate:Na+ symporter
MSASLLAAALGGLGLLLLGMGMMTDGLKAAAGNALRDFLERSTRTRPRAALMGFLVTALVQSSSAVIVATLGFTNAGILRLRQAAWVVFGSNIGTTMTAWIVALVGLRIKVEIVALPLIGLGMLLRLVRPEARLGHVGLALAGFGLLFLGLGLLRDAFIDVADWIPIARLGTSGALGIVLGVLAGALLTALIQSSSAALAIVLTASVTGVLTPLLGASLVIGANIGTTATSVLASIGATANARRLATVHVAEKVLTASVALCLLAPLWWLSETLSGGAERANISTGLALFHTVFNLLGMLLMVFLADPLLRRVERWIPQPELLSQKPRYIDDTVLDIPAMGLSALHSELKRVFKQLLGRGRQLINVAEEAPPESDLSTGALLAAIAEFGNRLGARSMPDAGAEQLLSLTTARDECQRLRDVLVELERLPVDDVQAALSPELTETFLSLLRSGELKAMTVKQRNRQVKRARRLRRQYRTALLERIRSDSLSAAQATRHLHVIALLEAGMKHIARIAEVIYPEDHAAAENAAPAPQESVDGGQATAAANAD